MYIHPYISLPFVNSGVCQGLYNSSGAWPSLFYANANSWYLVLSGVCKKLLETLLDDIHEEQTLIFFIFAGKVI